MSEMWKNITMWKVSLCIDEPTSAAHLSFYRALY